MKQSSVPVLFSLALLLVVAYPSLLPDASDVHDPDEPLRFGNR